MCGKAAAGLQLMLCKVRSPERRKKTPRKGKYGVDTEKFASVCFQEKLIAAPRENLLGFVAGSVAKGQVVGAQYLENFQYRVLQQLSVRDVQILLTHFTGGKFEEFFESSMKRMSSWSETLHK